RCLSSLNQLSIRFLVFAVASITAFAQSQTGSLSGEVQDPGKAPVPGVAVDITMAEEHITLHTVSNDAGVYVFPNVAPGNYTISAEKQGFKKLVRNNVQIFIAQRQTLDLPLEIGDVKQSVEVTATQSILDTETSEKGQTLTPRMYATLPLW